MQIYRDLTTVPAIPTVATIGNFDGVHRGHQSVIAEVNARARALNVRSLAITFDPHPSRLLHPENPTPLITPTPRKLELLAETGLDATLVLPFTPALCHTSAHDFARDLLHNRVRAVEVHEGENFRFGYQAEAGIEGQNGLEAMGHELGFTVRVYTPRLVRGAPISSSRIRSLIAQGNLSLARALLGRPFAVDSTPAHGRGFGTKYAVPTINLAPYPELLPANGVYVTTLRIGPDPGSGEPAQTFQGVTNVGNRPTFGADSFAVESHLFDFHPVTLSPETPLRLTFLHRLRNEQRFPSTEALKARIFHDVTQAQRFFRLCPVTQP